MEMIIKKTIGSTVHTFVFTGNNLYDVVTESQKLSFPDVHACGKCGSTDLTLGTHLGKDSAGKEFKYTDIKCGNPKCRASLTFGRPSKDPDTFYLRKDDQGKYDWKEFKTEQSAPEPKQNTQPVKPPVTNNNNKSAAHTPSAKQPDKKGKPSGKALNYAMKITSAKNMITLDEICGKVKDAKDFTTEDIIYLRNECLRKRALLQSPAQAV